MRCPSHAALIESRALKIFFDVIRSIGLKTGDASTGERGFLLIDSPVPGYWARLQADFERIRQPLKPKFKRLKGHQRAPPGFACLEVALFDRRIKRSSPNACQFACLGNPVGESGMCHVLLVDRRSRMTGDVPAAALASCQRQTTQPNQRAK
jgi:hypothetical protein